MNKLEPPKPPVLVAGLGRAGEAALSALQSRYPGSQLYAWDASTVPAVKVKAKHWRARGVSVSLGGNGVSALDALMPGGALIKSPGIPMDTPLIHETLARGLLCIDELELGARLTSAPIVAVTGTNGKSTTCALISSALRNAGLGGEIVGNSEFGMPLSAAKPGQGFLVCEVSSFQLEACPAFAPEIAVFTNLTMEHLDRHGDMAAYGRIKSRMFVRDGSCKGTSVINIDDPFGRQLSDRVRAAGGRILSFGFGAGADIRIDEAVWDATGGRLMLKWGDRHYELHTRLPGRHNALNVAAAFAAALSAELQPAAIIPALQSTPPPPGRWQSVQTGAKFDVIIDYAHTPDGLEQFLSAARDITQRRGSSLHTVFGPVGLRDALKAHESGLRIARASDHVVLTTGSNPLSARVPRIKELKDAMRSCPRVDVVLCRKSAIRFAIRSAQPGDIVAILGLGALRRQIVDANGTTLPFDDRVCAIEALQDTSA